MPKEEEFATRDVEEDAPPLPTRPTGGDSSRPSSSPPRSPARNTRNEQFFTWAVQEVDGRKKSKATLSIANGSIMFSPGKSNSTPQQWPIDDLTYYNLEKKHVFLEFNHPKVSLDLHAGNKDTAEEIVRVLGEIAGANKAAGLREVITAAKSAGQKMGKVLYSFDAQGDDEVTVKEGENIFIIDSEKSSEWWMVRNASGQEGVIPSSYIEVAPEPTSSSRRMSFLPGRSSSVKKPERTKSKRGYFSSNKKDKERERDRENDEQEEYSRQQDRRRAKEEARSKPDSNKIRTWTDRTGTFKVDAQFLGTIDGKIHLHKLNGVKIAVAASKMSVEDLEYVERVTGMSLDDDKPLVNIKQNTVKSHAANRSNSQRDSHKERESQRESHRDRRDSHRDRTTSNNNSGILTIPGGVSTGPSSNAAPPIVSNVSASAQPQKQTQPSQPAQPEYDWFGFFLDCGVDINNCQRYAINFNRDQMDESVLEDITPDVLRTLGLKEGDILRVSKRLDEKFERRRAGKLEDNKTGGLFSGPGGALKNNTQKDTASVEPTQVQQPQQPQPVAPQPSTTQSFDDDAWAVKTPAPVAPAAPAAPIAPAAPPVRSAASTSSAPVSAAPTGVVQDLMDFKPLEPVKTAASVKSLSTPALPAQVTGSSAPRTTAAPIVIPVSIPIQIGAQPTGPMDPLGPFATGVAQVVTGGPFAPIRGQATGGYVFQQQTGFNSSATGFVPQQQTGFVSSTPGFVPQTIQQSVTGGGPFSGQPTGGPFVNQPTGGPFANQPTGGPFTNQPTGGGFGTQNGFVSATPGFVPQQQTGFNAQPALTGQRTGPFVQQPTGFNPQQTGGALMISQITGGASGPSLAQLQQQKQQQPTTQFGFGQPQMQPQATNMFGQPPVTSFGQPPTTTFGQPPVMSFGQPQVSFGQTPMTTFGQVQPQNTFANVQPQPTFGQPQFGAPPATNFGALQPQQTQFGAPPVTSFGFGQQPQQFQQQQQQQPQPQFGNLTNQFQQMSFQQPLQNQPTGFGFGNVQSQSSLQPTPTGNRKANLAAATPQNPFGF